MNVRVLPPLPSVLAAATFAERLQRLERLTQQFAQRAAAHDKSGEFTFENFAQLHAEQLLALTVPRDQGGLGFGLAEAVQVVGQVAKADPSTALTLAMQYLQLHSLNTRAHWPAAVKQQVLSSAVLEGALINALRVEPQLGSPSRGGLPNSIATRTEQGWLLTGSKQYCTGSHGLTWFSVFARTDDPSPLLGSWLVHKDTPGIRIIEDWDQLGMRATASHLIEFDQVLIPLERVSRLRPASDPDSRSDLDSNGLLWMNSLLGALYNGIAQAARDWLVQWLHERQPSGLGASLATLPRFAQLVGQIDSLLLSNRSLLNSAVTGQLAEHEFSQLKYLTTDNAIRAVSLALEGSGNPGLAKSNPLERHYRNVLCGRVHTPQNDAVLLSSGQTALLLSVPNKDLPA